MRYNGDKSTNLQFNSLNGLNEAIESAVNLILEYEEEHDRKAAKAQNNYDVEAVGSKMNRPDNGMNGMNGYNDGMGSNPHDQKEVYQPRPFDEGLKVDQPMYEMQNNENAMGNNPNYNQNYEQTYENSPDPYQNGHSGAPSDQQYDAQYNGNQMGSPYSQNNNQMDLMNKGYQFNVNHHYPPNSGNMPALERNQRYIDKLYCKTKKATSANKPKLKSRNYASGSSQYDYMIRRPYEYIPYAGFYNTFNELDTHHHTDYKPLGEEFNAPAQVVRYPVYVSKYDTELINRLYSIGNVFI